MLIVAVHILELLIDEAAMPRGMQVRALGLSNSDIILKGWGGWIVSPAIILPEAGRLPRVPGQNDLRR